VPQNGANVETKIAEWLDYLNSLKKNDIFDRVIKNSPAGGPLYNIPSDDMIFAKITEDSNKVYQIEYTKSKIPTDPAFFEMPPALGNIFSRGVQIYPISDNNLSVTRIKELINDLLKAFGFLLYGPKCNNCNKRIYFERWVAKKEGEIFVRESQNSHGLREDCGMEPFNRPIHLAEHFITCPSVHGGVKKFAELYRT
jgi:hypothetical protein